MVREFSLKGKTALITGAGRGIGTGIAEVFAEAGATVIVNSLTRAYLDKFAAGLSERTGQKVVPLTGDVTTVKGVEALLSQSLKVTGSVDVLVNNLGDSIRHPLVGLSDGEADLTDVDIQKILSLNLLAAIYCCRAFGRHMLSRRRGKVINISSFAALQGAPGNSLYSSAKSAITGLTRSLALEWVEHGVSVNAIAPGLFPDVATVGPDGYANAVQRAREGIPLRRVGELREIGLAALFLASDASNYVVGQTLAVDGGMTT